MQEPALYGLMNSNRSGDGYWGKNQFNSNFPVAIACYMRDKNIPAIYIKSNELLVEREEISVSKAFNAQDEEGLYFLFEDRFLPHKQFAYDEIERVDVVVARLNKDKKPGDHLRGLEVKLTVLPDNSTCARDENQWGTEIVIRPATEQHCFLGMALSLSEEISEVRDVFEPSCCNIKQWENEVEVRSAAEKIFEALEIFIKKFHAKQKPLILQPIWRTQGKMASLCDNAFDIFIWSDFAFCQMALDRAKSNGNIRYLRTVLRISRSLFELSRSGKANLRNIWSTMTYSAQSDKSFAINGMGTRQYMEHPRLNTPALKKEVLKEIILNGGEKLLQPERRFDQTIYFTAQDIFG